VPGSGNLGSNLHDIAERIIRNYTDPIEEELTPSDDDTDSADERDSSAESESIPTSDDEVPEDTLGLNLKRLTGHLLYAVMLREAVRDGDFGRIEDFQGLLAAMFCAGGSKNYCYEILHFILRLHHVWPTEFACVHCLYTLIYSDIP
jgi:hypothetical protein